MGTIADDVTAGMELPGSEDDEKEEGNTNVETPEATMGDSALRSSTTAEVPTNGVAGPLGMLTPRSQPSVAKEEDDEETTGSEQ